MTSPAGTPPAPAGGPHEHRDLHRHRDDLRPLQLPSSSQAGLVQQLSSQYGDQFTTEQAEYGVGQAGL
ncbi:Ltp family lipoprotein [Modestobacter altitudinis]|uniref:Ltp family lipoprotein n=1 Tax=Modestobacter altitudinis TaxID=2213158 RepID=UPI001486118D